MKKKKGWVGFLVGIFFGLAMAMPSFVLADVTVSGGTESNMVDLEGINNGSVTPGPYTTQNGTTRNAYVTDTGMISVNTTGDPGLWASVNGWNIDISDDGIVRAMDSTPYSVYGVIFNSISDGSGNFLSGTLTNAGRINAAYYDGIGVGIGTGTITNSGMIQGDLYGVYSNGSGTGTTALTNSGTIRAWQTGMSFNNLGTASVTNSGSIYAWDYNGIEFNNVGTAVVTNSGEITSHSDGDALYIYSDGALSTRIQNNVGGTILGYYNGIDFSSGGDATVQITNAGTITGENTYGIYIYSDGDLSATVTNSGVISDNDSGYGAIYIEGSGTGTATINNSGQIYTGDDYGSGDAVYIDGVGTATVNNYAGGNITGWSGVWIDGAGSVTINNSGGIYSNYNGILIENVTGAITLTNNAGGNITGWDGVWIYASGDDDDDYTAKVTINNSGSISGQTLGPEWDAHGIYIENADTATVTNSGSISGHADIEGLGAYGIYIGHANTATVTNSGSISASGDYDYYYTGISISSVGTAAVTNNAGGIIYGDYHGVSIDDADSATVTNSGLIWSEGSDAVYIVNGGTATVNNLAGGSLLSNNYDGIYIQSMDAATINNSGRIEGYFYGGECGGISLYDVGSATVNNYAGGQIYGYYGNGIVMDYLDSATVNNSGRIEGYYDGIYIGYANTATVTNNAGGLIQSFNGYGYGIYMEFLDSATVNNSGRIEGYYDGIYIGYADTATVTNNAGGSIQSYYGRGIAMEYIGGSATAEVINSGTIQAFGPHDDYGVGDAVYIGYSDVAKVTNNAGGLIQSFNGYGVGIVDVYDTVNVTNSGTIQSYNSGIGITGFDIFDDSGDSSPAVTVTNNETGVIQGGFLSGDDDDDMMAPPSGVSIFGVGTAEVTNKGTIQGVFAGVSAYVVGSDDDDDIPGSITVTNSGTIQGGYLGVGAGFADEVTVINKAGGTIQQIGDMEEGYGVGIMYVNDKVTVQNAGTISGYDDGVGIAYVDGDVEVTNEAGGVITGTAGNGIGIVNVTDTVAVQNAGIIRGYDNGVYIYSAGVAEVTNEAGGVITGNEGNGVGIFYADVAEVTNSGLIQANGELGSGVRIVYTGEAYLTNQAGGVIQGGPYGNGVSVEDVSSSAIKNYGTISGYYGIYAPSGNTIIDNYGTVTGTEGTAIQLYGDYNFVTLHTGSVINGAIVADNENPYNNMTLDGEGTIRANQIQQFSYLEKTGAGTWVLTGDYDYSLHSYDGHTTTVQEGVLALAERGGIGSGYGVVTDYFTQNSGASLGYVVTSTGRTGQLTVNEDADFGDGKIVVIPTLGTYAAETLYPQVLYVGAYVIVNGETVTDPTDPSWAQVTSTSAFLKPELLYNSDYSDYTYDLGLTRLSFTTGMPESLTGFAGVLDEMYDTATGDMRTFLDELLLLSPNDAVKGMATASGGSQTAMQFISANGLGKYLGVLNNHLSGGVSFAQKGSNSAMASGYPYTAQLALAGGGESLSDATPLLLAAVGNIGQGQVASGTNWGLWVDGYFSYGDRRSDDIITKYNQKLYGGMLGFDFRATDNLFFGISGGISTADLDFDDLEDEGKMTSYQGSLYACYNGMPWYAAGIFTFAYNDYEFDRYISFAPGLIAHSDYNGKEYVGYGEVGYKFNAGGVIIRPSVAFQVDYLSLDEFTETGAGMYNLDYDDNNIGSYQSFLGVNISGPIKLGASAVLTPELRLKWAHEFSNDDNMIKARLAGSGSGSSWWSVEAETLSRDTAIVGVGMNLKFNKNVAAYLQYDAQINSDFVTHTGLVGLRLEW